MTILEITRAAAEYLAKRSIENPRLNAEHLIAHTLGVKRLDLYLQFDTQLGEDQLAKLRDLTKRRGQGTPLQHLLGTVEFLGRTFLVDSRALIPRPETEQLAEIVIDRARRLPRAPRSILDAGTGSGVLGLTFALAFPESSVVAVDICDEALALAKENHTRAGAPANITFVQGDVCEGSTLAPFDAFDLVVANLPYIPSHDLSSLQLEVRQEPPKALDGGPAGWDLIERFLTVLPSALAPGALIALEIGVGQGDYLAGVLNRQNFRDIELLSDYTKLRRFLIAGYG